jgi:hypothetical protein
MGKRFLNRSDSQELRGLYQEVADIHLLASWMSFEYWDRKPAKRDLAVHILELWDRRTAEEERNLPPMIPNGAVIDLGKVNGNTTDKMPIWLPPKSRDLGWLPSHTLAAPFGTVVIDEVGDEINDLNKTKPDEPKVNWTVPTGAQITALVSDGCTANPDNPKATQGGACKNAVKSTVARYLLNLDPGDETWRHLFCQSSENRKCGAGEGPTAANTTPHAFVWTRETHPEVLNCGYKAGFPTGGVGGGFPTLINRTYRAYIGLRTMADKTVLNAFPFFEKNFQGGPPTFSFDTPEASIANRCETYFASFAGRVPNVPQSPWTRGILLATRNTGRADVNPRNGLDYMAQPTG